MEELAQPQQLLPHQERLLSLNIAVSDLFPRLDVPVGLHCHPEAVLQAGELVDGVGDAVVVGNAGDLVEAPDTLIVTIL